MINLILTGNLFLLKG